MAEIMEKSTVTNHSVAKVMTILEYMARQTEPRRLLDMSRELKMNSSTLLRFLATLQKCGYVAQDEITQRYRLTYKLCTLGNQVNQNTDIRSVCRPFMRQLSQMFGENVCLAVEENMRVVYIEIVEVSGTMIRSMQRIGNVAPMHCTGIGKLMLTQFSESKLDRLIAQEGLVRFTGNTLTSKPQLEEELRKIRIAGIAYDNEECELGARCVAGPVYDAAGRIIAGISVTGPATRMTNAFIEQRLPYFRQVLLQISEQMGYEKPEETSLTDGRLIR